MEQDLCYPRLGWLDHQRPRVIDRPVPELGESWQLSIGSPAVAPSCPLLNAVEIDQYHIFSKLYDVQIHKCVEIGFKYYI